MMVSSAQAALGSVVALWRYPVKSMMGEELNAADVTEGGLLGDRAYALVDSADGKVTSAKNPRKWPRLFDFRAVLAGAPAVGRELPAVRITLPDGTTVSSEQPDAHRILSTALEREVALHGAVRRLQEVGAPASAGPQTGTAEEYWPDMDGLDYRDTVTEFSLPEGTFFDCATVHVLTTATIDRLRELYPQGRFEARRFRPNIVVQPADGVTGFAENAWVGHTLAIGDTIRLNVTGPCPRCVMTTLPQGDLPKDAGILRTAAQHNQASVGVYASVLRGGTIRRGDAVRLE
jgi:uncharacterized protein